MLHLLGIQYVQAEFEADNVLAYLQKANSIQHVLSDGREGSVGMAGQGRRQG
jgi:hypothetical protein